MIVPVGWVSVSTCWGVSGTKLRRCTAWHRWEQLTWSSRDHQLVSRTMNRHDWTPPSCVVVMSPDWQSYRPTWLMSSARPATCVQWRPRRLELARENVTSWIISSLWRKSAEPRELRQWHGIGNIATWADYLISSDNNHKIIIKNKNLGSLHLSRGCSL